MKPAELYQIDLPGVSPVPVVAVNATGSQWPRVAARAIAQILGGLADEYELDGAAFAAPPENRDPFQSAPNLAFLSAADRTQLAPPQNAKVLDVVPWLRTLWALPAGDLPFLAHKGTTSLVVFWLTRGTPSSGEGRLLLGKQRGKESFHALPELEALMRIQDQRLYERLGLLATRFPDGFEG